MNLFNNRYSDIYLQEFFALITKFNTIIFCFFFNVRFFNVFESFFPARSLLEMLQLVKCSVGSKNNHEIITDNIITFDIDFSKHCFVICASTDKLSTGHYLLYLLFEFNLR